MNSAESSSRPTIEIAIAVVQNQGKFLIGKREEGVPLAGYWEFPGGKIIPGETPEEAAVRECLEETGLVVRITGVYPQASHTYEHGAVRLHFFACAVGEQQQELPARFRWVPADALDDFAFPPANGRMLEILRRALSS